MINWTVNEIDKIFQISLDALNGKDVDRFSKYTVQSLFIQFRALIELKELDQSTPEKLTAKYLSDISLHPELSALYRNNRVSAEVDKVCASFNKMTADAFIYSLFSYSGFKGLLNFIIDKYTLNNKYKDDKIITEMYVKYLWFITKKPLNIAAPGGAFCVVFDVGAQAAKSPITWTCEYQGQKIQDSLNLR